MRAYALYIPGLRNPLTDSDNPVLITNHKIRRGFAGLPSNYEVLPLIDLDESAVSGITYSTNPIEPIKEAESIEIRLVDSQRILPSIWSNEVYETDYRLIQLDHTIIKDSDTTLYAIAANAPVAGDVFYLNGEAIKITSVKESTAYASNYYELTVTRGVNGTSARQHKVRPLQYFRNYSGTGQRQIAIPFMDFESYNYSAIFYYLDVKYNVVQSIKLKQFGFIQGNPYYDIESGVWIIKFNGNGTLIYNHEIGKGKREPIKPSLSIELGGIKNYNRPQLGSVSIPDLFDMANNVILNAIIRLRLREAEELFNEPFRDNPDSNVMNDAAVSDFNAAIQNIMTDVDINLMVSMGDKKYLFKIEKASKENITILYGNFDVLRLDCTLIESKGAISEILKTDSPIIGGLEIFDEIFSRNGIMDLKNNKDISIELDLGFKCSPFKMLLYLICSGNGDGFNNATFDSIPMDIGANINGDSLKIGTDESDYTAIAENTDEFLKHIRKHDYLYPIHIRPGDKLADIINNVALMHCMISGIDYSTGQWGLRKYFRIAQESPITIYPAIQSIVKTKKLKKVRRIRIKSEFDVFDNKPKKEHIIDLLSVSSNKDDEEIVINLYGNAVSDDLLQTNSTLIKNVVSAFFLLMRNGAIIYEVSIPLEYLFDQNIRYSDKCLYSDDLIPDKANGYGFEDKNTICLDVDMDFTGIANIQLLPDLINLISMSHSKRLPSLLVSSVDSIAGSLVTVTVESLGDPSLNLNTSYNNLYNALINDRAYLRCYNPNYHNPIGNKEREGYLECYATIDSIRDINVITLNIDTSWERGGFSLSDLFEDGNTIIEISDYRGINSNVQSVAMAPDSLVKPDNEDYAIIISDIMTLFNGHIPTIEQG